MTESSLRTLTRLNLPAWPLFTGYERLSEYIEGIEEQYHAELLFAAPHELASFCEYLNPEEPPSAALHQYFCKVLMEVERRDLMRLLVSVPPGFAKTTYFSRLFPVWYLGRNPDHKWIQAGHSQKFVENEFGKVNRALVNSDRYKKVFPEITLSKDSAAADSWKLAGFKGGYLTRGIGQGISGYRANIIAVDDPFKSLKEANSALVRNEVFDWFQADFSRRRLPNSPIVIIATRWNQDDLIGRLADMTEKGIGEPYKIVNFPAFVEADNILGLPENSSLWPEFWTKEHLLNEKEELTASIWSSLFMGNPIESDGGVFEEGFLQYYDKLPVLGEEGSNIRRITISVDSAQKTTERHDWTVLTVWIETTDNKHYLADVIRRRVEINDLVLLVDRVAAFWKATRILVEDKGSGTSLLQLRGPTSKTPSLIPYIAITTKNLTKEFRFDSVVPMITMGIVLFPRQAHWLKDYISELLAFPNGKFDDQVDSTSQYLQNVRGSAKLGTRKLHTQ